MNDKSDANDERSCAFCAAKDHLEVHHRIYRSEGGEQPGDVTTLCAVCHAVAHLLRAGASKRIRSAVSKTVRLARQSRDIEGKATQKLRLSLERAENELAGLFEAGVKYAEDIKFEGTDLLMRIGAFDARVAELEQWASKLDPLQPIWNNEKGVKRFNPGVLKFPKDAGLDGKERAG